MLRGSPVSGSLSYPPHMINRLQASVAPIPLKVIFELVARQTSTKLLSMDDEATEKEMADMKLATKLSLEGTKSRAPAEGKVVGSSTKRKPVVIELGSSEDDDDILPPAKRAKQTAVEILSSPPAHVQGPLASRLLVV